MNVFFLYTKRLIYLILLGYIMLKMVGKKKIPVQIQTGLLL
jgi:hypothetical protein